MNIHADSISTAVIQSLTSLEQLSLPAFHGARDKVAPIPFSFVALTTVERL